MNRAREALSHWGPWMVLAYLGLVAVVAFGFSLYAKTLKRDTARQAAVARCLTSRPQLERISKHLHGVNLLADVLVTNTRASVTATPLSDPQRRSRLANLHRIEQARSDIAAVDRLPVPTVAQCQATQP